MKYVEILLVSEKVPPKRNAPTTILKKVSIKYLELRRKSMEIK